MFRLFMPIPNATAKPRTMPAKSTNAKGRNVAKFTVVAAGLTCDAEYTSANRTAPTNPVRIRTSLGDVVRLRVGLGSQLYFE